MGGGVTFVVMIALYDQLLKDGLSSHSAWRAAFAIVPVPILIGTAILTLVFGTDHPAGKWAERHNIPAVAISAPVAERVSGEKDIGDMDKEGQSHVAVLPVDESRKYPTLVVPISSAPESDDRFFVDITSEVDVAVNQVLTWKSASDILFSPLTWLPALAYFTTFGFELAVDANLANILFGLYKSPTFGQTKAGYVSVTFPSARESIAYWVVCRSRHCMGYSISGRDLWAGISAMSSIDAGVFPERNTSLSLVAYSKASSRSVSESTSSNTLPRTPNLPVCCASTKVTSDI